MNKIYEYEDKIEQAKFLLSALKIQTAFVNMMRIAQKKQIIYQRRFIDQLQRYSTFQIIHQSEDTINCVVQLYEQMRMKHLRRSFHRILHFSQQDRRVDRSRNRQYDGREYNIQNKMLPISVINEENWKQKLTAQQLEMHCRYYRQKIEQVEKSFADFFQVIKNQ